MGFVRIILLLLNSSYPYTHWYVDPKDNLVKPIHESAFALKPDVQGSIVNLQDQEKDLAEIKKLQGALIETKHILDEAEEEVDLEPNHYETDPDCIKAGKKLPDFDLYQTTVIPPTHRGVNTKTYFTKCTECPECRSQEDRERFNAETARTLMPYCSVIDLPYILNPFDHLDGVQTARELPELRETALTPVLYYLGNTIDDFPPRSDYHESAYKDGNNIDQMGHCITIALSRNYDDWVLYNLASIFWRIKGNSHEAIECSRRAYYYAPYQYRDMPLVNMANVLHKQGYTQNATVLLQSANEIFPGYSLNYFALGNMYSVMEDYTEAVLHYTYALEKQPNFDQALLRRNAVLCQAKLHHKLEQQHESLKRTLDELRKFKEKQDEYRKRLENLDQRRTNQSTQIKFNKIYEAQFVKQLFPHRKSASVQQTDRYSLNRQLSLETDQSQKGPNSTRKNANQKRSKSKVEVNSNIYYEVGEDGNSRQIIYSPLRHHYDWNHPDWPTLETCDHHVHRLPEWNEYPSSYVDPESRGIDVIKLLADDLQIPQDKIVDQPWRRPLCTDWEDLPYIAELDEIPGIKMRESIPMQKQDEYMLRILLDHINNGRVWPDAIGERIYLAVEKNKREYPSKLWALYNLAGLYWRVNGENIQSLECLRRAYANAPDDQRDIVLVQLANIMYRLGRISDSVMLLRRALEINVREPISYYTMGTNLVAMNNITGAIEFFSYALYLNPDYIEAFQCLFINKCALLREKHKVDPPLPPAGEEDIHMFWEKAWKPSLWETPQDSVRSEEEEFLARQERLGFKLVQEKVYPYESDEDRSLRYKKRHEKYGQLAQQLSDESEHQIPIEHIELLLEVIEDELNSKRPSIDRISQLVDVPLRQNSQVADDKLKYQIAKTLLNKLTTVKEFAEGKARTIFDHLDKAR